MKKIDKIDLMFYGVYIFMVLILEEKVRMCLVFNVLDVEIEAMVLLLIMGIIERYGIHNFVPNRKNTAMADFGTSSAGAMLLIGEVVNEHGAWGGGPVFDKRFLPSKKSKKTKK